MLGVIYRIVGTNRDANRCYRCGRCFLSRVVWLQAVVDGKDVGEPAPYGTDCAARLSGRSIPSIEKAARLAGCRMPRRMKQADDMPLFAQPPTPPAVESVKPPARANVDDGEYVCWLVEICGKFDAIEAADSQDGIGAGIGRARLLTALLRLELHKQVRRLPGNVYELAQ